MIALTINLFGKDSPEQTITAGAYRKLLAHAGDHTISHGACYTDSEGRRVQAMTLTIK